MGEDGFVAEDAVEGGATDAQLAGGAEFVAAVEVEYGLDVMADDGVEVETLGLERGWSPRAECGARTSGRPRLPGAKIGISTPRARACE